MLKEQIKLVKNHHHIIKGNKLSSDDTFKRQVQEISIKAGFHVGLPWSN